MTINTSIPCNKGNYGAKRDVKSIKYLVFHFTANKTDTAKANATYFKNNVVKASAHYFVDEKEIYQSVPDDITAWSVGGSKWNDVATTGGGTLYDIAKNANTINVEMCSTNSDISEATQALAAELGKELIKKYNIPMNNVIRHFDVTGKHCPGWPGWYGKDDSKWNSFKARLAKTDIPAPVPTPEPEKSEDVSSLLKVRIDVSTLNIRRGPGVTYSKNGYVRKGEVYTIVETKGSWGRLKSGAGWISISKTYVSVV